MPLYLDHQEICF